MSTYALDTYLNIFKIVRYNRVSTMYFKIPSLCVIKY